MFERKDLYAYGAGLGGAIGGALGLLLTLGAARNHEMSWRQKVALPAMLGGAGAFFGAVDVFTQLKHPGLSKRIQPPPEDAPAKEKLKYAFLALLPKPPSYYVY